MSGIGPRVTQGGYHPTSTKTSNWTSSGHLQRKETEKSSIKITKERGHVEA